MRVDLHIHTIASDGCWTPERVVTEAQAQGIGLLAIADHDTIASVPLTAALVREAGLAFLRGVEVNTRLEGNLFHILAYGFDPDNPALTALLRENRARLDQFNEDVVHCLIAAGYPIDLNDYAAYEYDPSRGGWKALNFLIERGFCTDVRDYIRNLLAHLSIDYPPFLHPAQVITIIRQADGVPILAHPGANLRRVNVMDEILALFVDFGIRGLECYSPNHDDAMTRFCLDWCNRHGWLVTGGSDCHGGFAGRKLGVPSIDGADLRLGELEERIVR